MEQTFEKNLCATCQFNDIGDVGGKRDEAKMMCYQCVNFDMYQELENHWYGESPWGRGD